MYKFVAWKSSGIISETVWFAGKPGKPALVELAACSLPLSQPFRLALRLLALTGLGPDTPY